MIKSTKAFLLAGASALAILASAAEANAETFVFKKAAQSFTAMVSATMRSNSSAPAEGIRLPLVQ
jgi:flagellar hook protein FlgE